MTVTIRGINRHFTYAELGLESLSERRWYQKLLFFYKTVHGVSESLHKFYVTSKAPFILKIFKFLF